MSDLIEDAKMEINNLHASVNAINRCKAVAGRILDTPTLAYGWKNKGSMDYIPLLGALSTNQMKELENTILKMLNQNIKDAEEQLRSSIRQQDMEENVKSSGKPLRELTEQEIMDRDHWKKRALSYLRDRPCEVCKCHTEHGCSEWSCVFEEEVKEK